jgi:putative heme iron utilization protein
MEDDKNSPLLPTTAEAIRLAKTLLRTARHAAIATLDPGTGAPRASRVGMSTDTDGTPIVLISRLAPHTGALLADPRCSLLVGEPGRGDPLAHPRLSLSCRATELARASPDSDRVARRYLARSPKAKLYAGLGDFGFFRLEVQSASLNGGFGRAYALSAADVLAASVANAGIAESEPGVLEHMNTDHAAAVELYARHFARGSAGNWKLTGIDAEGIDLADGDDTRRVFFDQPLTSADEIRAVLVRMAGEARAAHGRTA